MKNARMREEEKVEASKIDKKAVSKRKRECQKHEKRIETVMRTGGTVDDNFARIELERLRSRIAECERQIELRTTYDKVMA